MLHYVYASTIKGLFKKGRPTKKKNLMRSHVLTKQNTILVKKETVMIKYGKEAFIFLFPLMK